MKYLDYHTLRQLVITLALFSKEKHEPIKLQKIEIGAKFENLNKIGLMSPSLPPDFFTL